MKNSLFEGQITVNQAPGTTRMLRIHPSLPTYLTYLPYLPTLHG